MKDLQDEIRALTAQIEALQNYPSGDRSPASSEAVTVFPAGRTAAPRPSQGTSTTRNTTVTATPAPTPYRGDSTAGASQRPITYPSQASYGSPQSLTEQRAMLQLQMTWHQLEAKTSEINQLSAAQEAALRDVRAIAQKLERDWRSTGVDIFPFAKISGDFSGLYHQTAAEVPYIDRTEDGHFTLSTRTLDLVKAERDAVQVAHNLRQRRPRTGWLTPNGQALWQWLSNLCTPASDPTPSSPPTPTESRSVRPRTRKPAVPQEDPAIPLPGAIALLVGSAATRMAIDAMLVSNPMLWFPAVGIMVLPAAIAAYQATVAPETSLKWGYRLLVILVGLLLGGRL